MPIDVDDIYFDMKYNIDDDGNIDNISFNAVMKNDAPDLNAHIYSINENIKFLGENPNYTKENSQKINQLYQKD